MDKLAPALRVIAVVMVVVVLGTVTAPAPAHADVLAAAGLATLAVVGVIIIVYLIAANVSERRTSEAFPVSLVAASGSVVGEAP